MAEFRRRKSRALVLGASLLTLAACGGEPLDFDLRNPAFGADTSGAARGVVEDRPNPDNRGVISYPNFQVAVAAARRHHRRCGGPRRRRCERIGAL